MRAQFGKSDIIEAFEEPEICGWKVLIEARVQHFAVRKGPPPSHTGTFLGLFHATQAPAVWSAMVAPVSPSFYSGAHWHPENLPAEGERGHAGLEGDLRGSAGAQTSTSD
jgi:hypothetical protein